MKNPLRCLAVLLCLVCTLPAASETDRGSVISLNSGVLDILAPEPAMPASLKAFAAESGSEEYLLVKFPGPVTADQYRELDKRSERIYTYLPHDTFLVRMRAEEQDKLGDAALGASWTGLYHPAYKLAPAVTAIAADASGKAGEAPRIVMLHVFPDADLTAVRNEIERLAPGKVVGSSKGKRFSRVRLLLERGKVAAVREPLARMKDVFWIGIESRRVLLNDTTVWVAQSGTTGGQQTPIHDQGILGQGQIVGILDTGIDPDMCYFRDPALGLPPVNACNGGTVVDNNQRKVIAVDFLWSSECSGGISSSEWDTHDHGSHVAGTVAGDDFANLLSHDAGDGLAPGAKLVIQDCGFQTNACADCPGIGCPVTDLNPVFQQPYDQGARIHTNSWGDDEDNPNGGQYSSGSEDSDEFMWNHKDFLLLFAAGNSGPGSNTVLSPSTAKNVVAVGATNRSTSAESMASFSSCGPTDDGRIKPDVTMPGNSIISANNDINTGTNNCGTRSMSGTSMASPGVAGAAALVRQYYTDGWYPSGAANPPDAFTPSAALLKATLINSGHDMTGVAAIPSNCQGWGRVKLDDTLAFSSQTPALAVEDDTTGFAQGSSGEDRVFNYTVSSGTPLKVTLTWTDFPSTPAANPNIVNDLDLIVSGPGGTYLGNVFSGGQSTTGGTADRLNTVEQVLLSSPPAGAYTVTVRSFTVPSGPQPFAVVVTGDLGGQCSVDADCDDGLYCNGAETCNAGICQAGSDPCPGQGCDEGTDMCTNSNGPQNAVYDSGLGAPACAIAGSSCDSLALLDGRASLGPEPNQPNTLDTCTDGTSGSYHSDESNDKIVVSTLDGSDFSEGATVEVAATVYAWTTNTADTLDLYYAADASNPVWVHITSITPPSAGLNTLTAQYTLPAGSLQAVRANFRYQGSQSSCSGGSFDDADDLAFAVGGGAPQCTVDGDCDDGLYCNGSETCNAGSCQSGTAPNCGDGVSCTVDTCNEGTDSCDNTPDDGLCDNGLFCDGSETCSATLDCQAGTAPNCNDGVGCTDDSCNEGTDSCDNTPNNGSCDDGLFCNGSETCSATLDCQAGSDPCGVFGCDEGADICLECNVDADCDNGLFCDGAETCNAGSCQAGSDPCPGQSCDEGTDQCVAGGACSHSADFTSGAGGWTQGADTCSTGAFVVGTPDATAWQVGGGNPGQTFFTANNPGGVGTDDVDGGTCEALSPVVDCAGQEAAEVSLDYFHGQRDAGDDSGDGFTIEVLNDGIVVDTMVSIGDVTHAAAWTSVSTVVANPGNVQVRVRAADAAAGGDIVEGGIDNVQVSPTTPPVPCSVEEDFEGGAGGWTNSGSSTCSTGAFVTATPTLQSGSGVITQVGGDHTTGTGNAFFSATNTSAGANDVDGGTCIVTSPVYAVGEASDVSVWYFHGQRDAGGDDFFLLEISTNGGGSWTPMVSIGAVTTNAAWTEATTSVAAGANVQFRVQVADGPSSGDLIEGGVDDVTICPSN